MGLHLSEERLNKCREKINKDTISNFKGMTLSQISEITGINLAIISKILKLDNLEIEKVKPSLSLEIIKDMYLIQRIKPNIIARKLQITREELDQIIKENNLKEEKEQNRKNRMIEKYGSASPFNSKEVREKSKQTKLEKYGEEYFNNRDLAKVTNLERYSSNSPLGNREIYEATLKSNRENHNGILAFNTEESVKNHNYKEIRRKSLETLKRTKKIDVPIQNLFTDKQKEILLNKENFEKYIQERYDKNRNAKAIYEELDIQHSVFYNYFYKYELDKKFTFNTSASLEEIKIVEWLNQVKPGIEIIRNYRQLKDKENKVIELDIYLPEYRVAIEYNGNYWHSQKDKNYHYNKSRACEENNIRLIHIFEYEWYNERQRPILENIIKNAIGINENKIFARKCKIEIKQSKDLREFFDTNNIQGYRAGKFAICLVYENEVVMSYIIGDAFFGKGKYQYEVIRGATKLGYTVVGGASKIWKYFIENYDPESCVYYIDYNYFNGNSLPYLGLKYITTKISFKNYWVKEKVVKNREPKKHKEIKELEELGLVVPIYNAGVKVYVYNK